MGRLGWLLVVLGVWDIPAPVHALQCSEVAPPMREQLEFAPWVFEGRVVEVRPVNGTEPWNPSRIIFWKVRFEVLRVWKGELPSQVVLGYREIQGFRSRPRLFRGDRYLLFAHGTDGMGTFTTYCGSSYPGPSDPQAAALDRLAPRGGCASCHVGAAASHDFAALLWSLLLLPWLRRPPPSASRR